MVELKWTRISLILISNSLRCGQFSNTIQYEMQKCTEPEPENLNFYLVPKIYNHLSGGNNLQYLILICNFAIGYQIPANVHMYVYYNLLKKRSENEKTHRYAYGCNL